jgi:hypothetical protein
MTYHDYQWYKPWFTPEDIVTKSKSAKESDYIALVTDTVLYSREILQEQLPSFKRQSVSDGTF